jgi:hypothetical protein
MSRHFVKIAVPVLIFIPDGETPGKIFFAQSSQNVVPNPAEIF